MSASGWSSILADSRLGMSSHSNDEEMPCPLAEMPPRPLSWQIAGIEADPADMSEINCSLFPGGKMSTTDSWQDKSAGIQ